MRKIIVDKEIIVQKIINEKKGINQTAKELGIAKQTLVKSMKLYGLWKPKAPENIKGQKFNNWEVLDFYEKTINGDTRWVCQCKCGRVKVLYKIALSNNHTKQCRKCAGESSRVKEEFRESFFNNITKQAKHRGIEFSLTRDYLYNLFLFQNRKCALTGLNIYFADNSIGFKSGEGNASLDRIDNNKGYIEGNVQWVDKKINRMKSVFDETVFIYLCKMVVNGPKCAKIFEPKQL